MPRILFVFVCYVLCFASYLGNPTRLYAQEPIAIFPFDEVYNERFAVGYPRQFRSELRSGAYILQDDSGNGSLELSSGAHAETRIAIPPTFSVVARFSVSSAGANGDARILAKATSSAAEDHSLMISLFDSTKVRARVKVDSLGENPLLLLGGQVQNGLNTVVLTFDGTPANQKAALYLNGSLIEERVVMGIPVDNPNQPLRFGVNDQNGYGPLGGSIDHVEFFDRALSVCEVSAASVPERNRICGDGCRQEGEQCDDGNTTPGDGCSNSCNLELCLDGIDNDGDGAIDEDDFSCLIPGSDSESLMLAECQDGIDNDGNGLIDFPADPQCSSNQDNNESENAADCTFITRSGVTWTFATPVQCGQFVNGDWWVIDEGAGVRLSSISPTPSYGATGRNGSQKNVHIQGGYPFDARMKASTNLSVYSEQQAYYLSEPLFAGDVLASSVSHDDEASHIDLLGLSIGMNHATLKNMAFLTVLGSEPSANAFRPPYVGTDRTIYTLDDVDFAVLPSLPLTAGSLTYDSGVNGTPAEKLLPFFAHSWVWLLDDWKDRVIHPTDSTPNYHQHTFQVLADALVTAISEDPNKEELIIKLIQTGIDMHASAIDAQLQGYAKPPSAVHIGLQLLVGKLLGNPSMMNPTTPFRSAWMTYRCANTTSTVESNIVPPGLAWWAHAQFANNNDPFQANPACWRQDPGTSKEHEHLWPNGEWCGNCSFDPPFGGARELYRGINSSTWPGAQLAILAVGLMQNHPSEAYCSYVDRWMLQDFSAQLSFLQNVGMGWAIEYFPQGTASSSLVSNMYFAHRGSLGACP